MKITDRQLIDAIRKNAGIVSGIMDTLRDDYGVNITRDAIYKRKQASKRIAEAFAEAEESVLDAAESNIISYIRSGNLKATMFYLRLKGRKRGYTTIDTESEQAANKDAIHIVFERNGGDRMDICTIEA